LSDMIRILLAILFLFAGSSVLYAQNSAWSASGSQNESGYSSINESNSQLDVRVFPNPVDNKWFTVELSSQNIQEIRITNIAGATVYIRKFQGHVSMYRVNLENVPNGIYLLRVTSDNLLTKTTKLLLRTQ
jgi:hypothetical protein